MLSIVLAVHVLLAIAVITLVLLQHGKGADAGAAFGSGASATVFGARGSASFLVKLTTMFATLFFVTSIGLAYLAAQRSAGTGSVTEIPVEQAAETVPQSATDVPEQPVDPEADVPKVD